MSKSQFQKEYEEYQKYKEWQEVLCCKNAQEVIDFVMSNYLTEDEKCKTIAEQSYRIAELEEQLKNAIVPKFKVGQECYVLLGKVIEKIIIVGCRIKISKMEDENFTMYSITDIQGYACSVMEEQLFATKEEAQAKLEELKGENNEKV